MLLTRKELNVGCMDESGSCMDESVGCMDKKEMSNEEFISYFKRLSKDEKIAAFGELFERFKNACEENRKLWQSIYRLKREFMESNRMPVERPQYDDTPMRYGLLDHVLNNNN